MAKITMFQGYEGEPPFPKPKEKVLPNIVTAQEGVPVKYPDCEGSEASNCGLSPALKLFVVNNQHFFE